MCIHHVIVPALVFQRFRGVGESEQIGLCGQIITAGTSQVVQVLTQFAGHSVFTPAFE
ncbi:hypothetical protein DFO62_12662 [Serratia fonticola]|nr:hypothetical protein DFO62_12662 [Serratia fonticola]